MNDATVAAPQAATGDAITQKLTAAFTPPEVDNTAVEEPLTVEEPKADEPTKEPEEPKPEEEVAEEEPQGEPDADFYPSNAEELKAKWPRSVPLYCITQAAQWAEEAKEGSAIRDRLGDAFIEPLAKMAEALRDDSNDPNAYVPFLTGVMEAGGEDALLKVLSQSLYVGLVKGPDWAENPDTADFGKELQRRADAFFEMRFGIPASRIAVATDWERDGSLDRFNSFLESDYKDEEGDIDEAKLFDAAKKLYNETRSIRNDPVKKRLAEENAALRRQPEKPEEKVQAQDDGAFSTYLGHAVDTVLEQVILKGSPLMDVKDDPEDLKEYKQLFREQLAQSMRNAIERSKNTPNLATGFRRGEERTAKYRENLTRIIDAEGIPAIQAQKLKAENLIAKAYGKTRNAKLAETKPEPTPPVEQEPTKPTDFAPQQGTKSIRDVQNRLEQAFANQA